jgi:hypothetical protein
MRITEIPFPVLRLQYRIAREPLELVDKRFVSRMDSEAPARLLYERSVGALDAAVGNVLREVKLRLRGTVLAERSGTLGRAALDVAATRKKEQAVEFLADAEKQKRKEASAAGGW